MKRRYFMSQASKIVGGIAVSQALPFPKIYGKTSAIAPSDKVRLAVIGAKGMGSSIMNSMLKLPEIDVVALCDVDDSVLTNRLKDLDKAGRKQVPTFKDFRKLLEQKDIDAVAIATPDHWHALPMILACETGRDVYVEKPVGRTIEECNVMLAAARKYNRVVQVGQWQRSHKHWQDALDFVKSGKLGKIRLVKTWAYQGWMKTIPIKPDSAIPKGVDYDMWLGPAPKRAFNENRFHFNFRWFWDYAGGLITDWGVHIIDMGLAGLGVQGAKSVMASGGQFYGEPTAMETPDTLQAIYEFEGVTMIWEHANSLNIGPYGRDHGVAFIGNNGTLVVDRSGWEVLPEPNRVGWADVKGDKMEAVPLIKAEGNGLDFHTRNFLDCMKSRQKPNCDIAIAQNTALNCSLGNIAYRTNRKIFWDAAKQTIINDPEADLLTKANYQNGWKLG
ncbi:MAG: Gfo/Idh/MocA family oxidoreductase [Saprospiraceae bacterium]|nr:Gfo/Idh/MocA family oxidoreductase [Saprospiraceae bacterium]